MTDKQDDFVQVHVHSYNSIMDGYNSPYELAEWAAEHGQPAIAITDHGTLAGHRALQQACREFDVKPILGCEVYFSPTDRFDRRPVAKRDDNTQLYNHLIVLAKDQAGLENLNRLSEAAWTEGYYYKPRIDLELLEEYHEGLILTSACMNGPVSKALRTVDDEGNEDWVYTKEAVEWAKKFQDIFGDDFYIELQPHNPDNLNVNLLKVADELGIKAIATTDCHFGREEDRDVEETLLILSTHPKEKKVDGKKLTYSDVEAEDIFDLYSKVYEERPISFEHIDVHMMPREQIEREIQKQFINRPDLYDNTMDIYSKIGEYDYPEKLDLLPTPVENPDSALRERCIEGLRNKGLWGIEKYEKRLDSELEVISDKNFSKYFLIVEDIVTWARDNNILVGPGRGSAAGALTCYALGITDVDPIHYNLLFFRFISPDRDDYPDIDIDFESDRRADVKEYIREKYEHSANISTYGTYSGKSVVKAVCRALRIDYGEANRFTKAFPGTAKEVTVDIMAESEKGQEFSEKYPEVFDLARRLEDRVNQTGMHAGGVIISDRPVTEFAPIETRKDPDERVSQRVPCVAYDMRDCEDIGLIKFDILGLSTLDVIHDTLDKVKERHDYDIDLNSIPLDDDSIFEMLSEGHTTGVFQCDSGPYTGLLKEMEVHSFGELAASNALVRPGAADTVKPSFIARKWYEQGREHPEHGAEPVEYVHERVEPYLKDTYGLVVYQEQVMQVVMELGNFTGAEANKLRKIIGKKLSPEKMAPYKDKWMENAGALIGDDQAEQLWHDFEAHAGYSFNLSHAVAYSLLSYWTAWLKVNYSLEFIAACLENEGNANKQMDYLLEAKRLGIKVKLPHVNRSEPHFSIEGDSMRFGLTDIKYISDKVAEKIIENRPFESFEHFMEVKNTKHSGISSRVVDALDAIGAASFPDNPKRGDEDDYYYEYLGIPKFTSAELPDRVKAVITPIEDYTTDTQDAWVFCAIVKDVMRGVTNKRRWQRVEFVDRTGKTGAFTDANRKFEEGKQYFFLVSSNRVDDYCTVDEVVKNLDNTKIHDGFINYLASRQLGVQRKGEVYVVAASPFKTKKGKTMASIVVANNEKKLRRVMVWAYLWGKYASMLVPGNRVKMGMKPIDDNPEQGWMLTGVKNV